MNELVEKLKQNTKPFGLLSKEEQECLRQNKPFLQRYNGGRWESYSEYSLNEIDKAYRISPDYQPEPEVIECEVEINQYGHLAFEFDGIDGCIEEALSFPAFIGYKYANYGAKLFDRPRILADRIDQPALIPTHVLFRKES